MCGRYSLTSPPDAMRRAFEITGALPNFARRYNIAPTQAAPVVRPTSGAPGRELALLRWGLVPSWSKGPDHRYSMINARAETVRSKPAYRAAFLHRRCLVPADGFYEWRREPDGKQPYRIALTNEETFAFAGLWERWQEEGGDEIESFTIIVTQANDTIRPIHDRMPVILPPDRHDLWLEGGPGAADEAEALLKPFHSLSVCAYPVSTFVNNPKNDDERCIARLDETGSR